MKITKYVVELEAQKNILVKESSKNYPQINELNSADKVTKMMNDCFRANKKAEEHVWLLAMNTKCHLIGAFEVSHGAVNFSVVQPREIFVRLCLCGATSFIVVHNHPSGDVTPSKQDMEVTSKLKNAAEIMSISMLDHIIIGGEQYYSFNENHIIVLD